MIVLSFQSKHPLTCYLFFLLLACWLGDIQEASSEQSSGVGHNIHGRFMLWILVMVEAMNAATLSWPAAIPWAKPMTTLPHKRIMTDNATMMIVGCITITKKGPHLAATDNCHQCHCYHCLDHLDFCCHCHFIVIYIGDIVIIIIVIIIVNIAIIIFDFNLTIILLSA